MHSLRLNVTDSYFPELLSLINNHPSDISIVEETQNPGFIVSSINEVRQRVTIAEERGNFSSHNDFWNNIDKLTDSL
jgi:hypothetical protein